jgi:hypothetical protein
LICNSASGSFQNKCLRDQGGSCTSDNDCVNFLQCQLGTCGCTSIEGYETIYNATTHKCDVTPLDGENSLCQNDDDCPEYLACNGSGVCLKRYGKLCAESAQCVNNLQCLEYICQCVSCLYIFIL